MLPNDDSNGSSGNLSLGEKFVSNKRIYISKDTGTKSPLCIIVIRVVQFPFLDGPLPERFLSYRVSHLVSIVTPEQKIKHSNQFWKGWNCVIEHFSHGKIYS